MKRAVLRLGFELRRTQSQPRRSRYKPVEAERTSHDYDLVWSDRDTLNSYVSKSRAKLYEEVIAFAVAEGVGPEIESIADVGCGPGHFTQMLSERFRPKRLVGFDFSREVLSVAQQVCPAAEFRQHDIYSPLADTFDVVFCTEVIEHLAYPSRAIDNLVAISGVIVLSIPNGRLDTYGGHVNFWSMESWKVFLERVHPLHTTITAYACEGRNILTVVRKK